MQARLLSLKSFASVQPSIVYQSIAVITIPMLALLFQRARVWWPWRDDYRIAVLRISEIWRRARTGREFTLGLRPEAVRAIIILFAEILTSETAILAAIEPKPPFGAWRRWRVVGEEIMRRIMRVVSVRLSGVGSRWGDGAARHNP
jgi:hypothetical protein